MNIFILDQDPTQAAMFLCDKHCVKMILESTQILSTVAQLRGFDGPYKITHKNHPVTQWVAKHPANWAWLVSHARFMCEEYRCRYNKVHKCEDLINELDSRSTKIWHDSRYEDHSDFWAQHTAFVQCVPEQYKQSNAVDAYRAYYIGDKSKFAIWKYPSITPPWFNREKNVI